MGTVPIATNDRSTVVQFLVEKVQLEMVGNLCSGQIADFVLALKQTRKSWVNDYVKDATT